VQYTQLINFELAPSCQFSPLHAFCPARLRQKQDLWPKERISTVEIVNAIFDLHKMGFRGFIGFHFYSDPMCSLNRIKEIVPVVKSQIKDQRFMLWTNAYNFIRPRPDAADLFDVAVLSFYSEHSNTQKQRAVKHAQEVCRSVGVHNETDDSRTDTSKLPDSEDTICLRPFTEMTFDATGEVRLCCQDWKGESCIGNLRKDGLTACVEEWIRARTNLFVGDNGYPEMHTKAPERCKFCKYRYGHHGWDQQILEKTKRYCIGKVRRPNSMVVEG